MESFLLAVVLLLLVGRTLGTVLQRYGFQSLIGEVLAGIIIGSALIIISTPYLIDVLPALEVLSQFGVIMLMLLSGLMTDYGMFQRNRKSSIVIGALGVIVTFCIIFGAFQLFLGPIFGLTTLANLFLAAILAVRPLSPIALFAAFLAVKLVPAALAAVTDRQTTVERAGSWPRKP